MQKVILHVGHAKTGTSYLQSLFALNTEFLDRHGIHYPEAPDHAKAKQGKITSGNHRLLLNSEINFGGMDQVLFSGEHLFVELLDGNMIRELRQNYDVKIFLYTRNLFDFALSDWGQQVKRHGLTSDLNSFVMKKGYNLYQHVLAWITMCEEVGAEIIVRNYTQWKSNLAEIFFGDLIGHDADLSTLKHPPQRQVNRSLTQTEYELQRIFNALMGQPRASFFSDYVVENFPELRSEPPHLIEETCEKVVKKYQSIVDTLNERMLHGERVSLSYSKYLNRDRNSLHVMSETDIQALASEITKNI
ncbi:MAG: hypothetical protein AAGG45_00395 [Pseudomonadota bacterium]